MKLTLLVALSSAVLISGCESLNKKKGDKTKPKAPVHSPATPAKEEHGDVAFQSFISRLRAAVAARDLPTLAALMTDDFGYRWDQGPQGETAFDYWDQNHLWSQLSTIINSKWTAHEGFMVAPPQMAVVPNYDGYRAGVAMVDGGWKFAYFVSAPPAE